MEALKWDESSEDSNPSDTVQNCKQNESNTVLDLLTGSSNDTVPHISSVNQYDV